MKKNRIFFILIIILAAGLLGGGAYAYNRLYRQPVKQAGLVDQESNQTIGGQKDEHGCLIAAGYGWCEAKQKCLRTWEEACSPADALKNYLRDNLSALSPEKEVLGGKFYVTDLKVLSPTKAEINYEDGHNLYRAQFDYNLNNDKVSIFNFKLIAESANPAPGKTPGQTSTASPAQQETVKLAFQPKQCEIEPWQEWYATGKTRFIKAPTDEELIKTYYGQEYSINIIAAGRVDSGNVTCDACHACNKSYSFAASVSPQDASRLEALGWEK